MATKELPPDFEKTIIRHIKLFKVVGLDIFDDRDCGVLKKYGKFLFYMIAFIILVVFEVGFLVTSEKRGVSFEDFADAVPCAIVFVQDIILLIVVVYRRNEIRELIYRMAEVWPNENDMSLEQRNILRNWLNRLRIFENSYLTVDVIVTIYFMSFPLVLTFYILISSQQEVYHYPFNIYTPVEIDSITKYLIKYALQTFSSFALHLCTHIPSILLLAAITVDISALMRVLQLDLENVVPERRIRQRGYEDTDQNEIRIKNVVKNHQKLLSLTEKVNKIFGLIVLVPVCLSAIILCFFGFLTTIVERVQVISNLIAVLSIQFEIFNLCWPGQLLADTSTGIAEAAYASFWYNSDAKSRKNIMTIIARSQKPCYISALGYTNMTLVTFTKVLSSSWSYLSLLRKIYQRNDA